jgi:hypothetical protein
VINSTQEGINDTYILKIPRKLCLVSIVQGNTSEKEYRLIVFALQADNLEIAKLRIIDNFKTDPTRHATRSPDLYSDDSD